MSELPLFLEQVAAKPREVVALAPSSRVLARRMAEAVPDGPGNFVELGAGTGKITATLPDAGVPVEGIHSFEINPVFRDHLKREHPELQVYRDRAVNFSRHGIEDIMAVVSRLPLLSMEEDMQRRIVRAALKHLRLARPCIRFTYGPVSARQEGRTQRAVIGLDAL